MFLPITKKEMDNLGWKQADIIIVSGDAYIDSPFSGEAVIGKYLSSKGFKVAIIPQPDINSPKDICRFGEPKLFWGVTGGCVDSLVANYTPLGKPRKNCDFTAGGINNRRPDRATIVYTGLIRRYFKNTVPIVLGGIEASLRRVAHYDFKTDKIRRSILFDSKADIICYGMAETSALELANALKNNENYKNIRGICYISKDLPDNIIELPSYEEVSNDKLLFHQMFKTFYNNFDVVTGKKLAQKVGDRYLIQNEPPIIDSNILDEVNCLDYERKSHPAQIGEVRAVATIKNSIISHIGCYGSCSFCAITVHQGRKVVSRSENSILKEIENMTKSKDFNGIISDIGGPTGNMYKSECLKMIKKGACTHKYCSYPKVCSSMNLSHKPLIDLLNKASKIKGVKKVFASSGIRCDIVYADKNYGEEYIKTIAYNHVSGQLKLAPESDDKTTLEQMKKPDNLSMIDFIKKYKEYSKKAGKNQFVTCYFMAAHPGSTNKSMENSKLFAEKYLSALPEQVQIFTPTPSTWSTCAYYTGLDENLNKVFCEKSIKGKEIQKNILLVKKYHKNRKK